MKQTYLTTAQAMRRLTLLLAMLLTVLAPAVAQTLESDDISAAILTEGSVPVRWTNDPSNPWRLNDAGNEITVSPLMAPETVTTLSMAYSSSYPVEISFQWYRNYNSSGEYFKVTDNDSEIISLSDNTSWTPYSFVLPAGSHTVKFEYFTADTDTDRRGVALREVRVWECKELESGCLQEGSMPVTFENDPENPWIAEDGYIRSTAMNVENSSSKISTTITVDKISLLSLERRCGYTYYDQMGNHTYIDGKLYNTQTSNEWEYLSVVLYPGTHKIEFEDFHSWAGNDNWTQIRNVRLHQNWIDVTLNNPGQLGFRLLQALGDGNLQDAELVKVTGTLNSDDWTTVSQLTGLHAIDMTDAVITDIPASTFCNSHWLSTVILPEGLKTIGNYAFKGINFYQVTIPASVESIGAECWRDSHIQYIDFAEGSRLKTIGFAAFYNCTWLEEFVMPNSVTELKRYQDYPTYSSETFNGCRSLRKLHLSDALKVLPPYTAYNCKALTDLQLPANLNTIEGAAFYATSSLEGVVLPDGLESIESEAFRDSGLKRIEFSPNLSNVGYYAFYGCGALEYARLNSHCWDMDNTFGDCTALKTLVLPSATPPSIKYDPFYNVDKRNVNLIVPDFALESYKNDTYWYNFTNTTVADDASINDYWALRGNLTLDNSHTMRGNPSVEMIEGSVLVMDTGTQQHFNDFIFNTSENAPASYLSTSNSVDAASLTTNFYVDQANRWYFFSPVADVRMADMTYSSTDSWVIRYYDGGRRASQNTTEGNWINVSSDGILHRGQGYIFQANAAGWLKMPVAAANHDQFFGIDAVNLPLADNACETEANAGWNFVSNPYPCYYDIYYIDMQAPITVWTGSTYRAYSLNDGDRGEDTFVLRPMQPFFVQKADTGTEAGMPIHGRRTSTVIDRTRAPRRVAETASHRDMLNLEILSATDTTAADYTRVVINESASTDYETRCDASKFMSLEASVAQLYTLGAKNLPLAINERPYADGNVALGVYTPVRGETYIIRPRRTDRQVWLHDAVTGVEHDLTLGEYNFTSTAAGHDTERFTLRFAPASTNAAGNVETVSAKVSGENGRIVVTAEDGVCVTIYSADGSICAKNIATGSEMAIEIPRGIYVVAVEGKTFKTVVK